MMKKQLCLLALIISAFVLVSCGSRQQALPKEGVIERQQTSSSIAAMQTESHAETTATASSEDTASSNILIAYFTVPETDGTDTVSSASRVATNQGVVGNTEFIAMEIQKNLGGDLFSIKTIQEYPGSHDALLDFAYNEKRENTRPELATHIESLDDYDYIFIGFPNWNADLPMPLYTFLEEYDFSEKTIIPFVTHGGSGFSRTIETIQELEPNATVIEAGLSVSRNQVADAQADVKQWTDALLAE